MLEYSNVFNLSMRLKEIVYLTIETLLTMIQFKHFSTHHNQN